MKTRAFRKTLAALCSVLLIACVLTCLKPVIGFAAYSYPNAARYSVGDTEIQKKISNLDVDWIDGKVSIAYHRDNTVELKETSKKKISNDMRMRWWLDSDTLHIRFAKPGFRQISPLQKNLTITLPMDMELDNVSIQATSGDLAIPALKADSIQLDVTSGDITAVAEARAIHSKAISGDLELTAVGNTKEVSAKSSSGTIDIQAETVGKLTAESSSGDIFIKANGFDAFFCSSTSGEIKTEAGALKKASVSSTSGSVRVDTDKFDALSISATSGDIAVSLPEKPGFTAKLSASSGNISYDMPLRKHGDAFICGSGSGELSISTTSGDIVIKK